MNGSRYILVEMPFFGAIEEHDYVEDALLACSPRDSCPSLPTLSASKSFS